MHRQSRVAIAILSFVALALLVPATSLADPPEAPYVVCAHYSTPYCGEIGGIQGDWQVQLSADDDPFVPYCDTGPFFGGFNPTLWDDPFTGYTYGESYECPGTSAGYIRVRVSEQNQDDWSDWSEIAPYTP